MSTLLVRPASTIRADAPASRNSRPSWSASRVEPAITPETTGTRPAASGPVGTSQPHLQTHLLESCRSCVGKIVCDTFTERDLI
jgi:hypothetical protein